MKDTQATRLLTNIVDLVDAMLVPFDVVELLDELVRACLDLVPAHSAGILLHDQRGSLRVLASSSEDSRHLELLELQHEQGPCYQALQTGESVTVEDLASCVGRWPAFATAAIERGVTSVYAVPMRVREHRIGGLNLFCTDDVRLDDEHLRVATVLGQMATLAIINHRFAREQEVLAQQLQSALQSRVLIEQAKGVIAEREGLDMAGSFAALRGKAGREKRLLSQVAFDIVAESEGEPRHAAVPLHRSTSRGPKPAPEGS